MHPYETSDLLPTECPERVSARLRRSKTNRLIQRLAGDKDALCEDAAIRLELMMPQTHTDYNLDQGYLDRPHHRSRFLRE